MVSTASVVSRRPSPRALRRSVVLAVTAMLGIAAPANADSAGLVGAWNFDEASGTTVTDVSGRGNHGTLSAATRVTGKNGKALSFNGINALVTVADSAALDLTSGMTLEAWVRPAKLTGSWRTIVIKERQAHLSYALYAGNDLSRPSGHVYTTRDASTAGPAALPLNTWKHIATTWNGATQRFYVDGVQVGTATLSGGALVSSSPVRFGGNKVWGEYFEGLIDDVRIYNRALSASEVNADRVTPVVPPCRFRSRPWSPRRSRPPRRHRLPCPRRCPPRRPRRAPRPRPLRRRSRLPRLRRRVPRQRARSPEPRRWAAISIRPLSARWKRGRRRPPRPAKPTGFHFSWTPVPMSPA